MLTTAVWLGMVLYMVRPVQAEAASNSFASWLDSVVKQHQDNSDDLQEKLYQLKQSDESLNRMIQRASEIVSHHNDEFNLPLKNAENNTKSVYNLLVWEWNSYQTGNGMGKASVPTTIKASFHPPVDKFSSSLSGSITPQPHHSFISGEQVCLTISRPFNSYHISPLSGGTAIGAP